MLNFYCVMYGDSVYFQVRDSMRFVEVALIEPEKHVVALADAYFFPPFQPSLIPRTKGGPLIPTKLPPRQARLVVYNKNSNETSIWIVELSEVHAVTRGGHHRGKVVSSKVIPDVQPPMVKKINPVFLYNHLFSCVMAVVHVSLCYFLSHSIRVKKTELVDLS